MKIDSSFFCPSQKHFWDGKSLIDQYPYGTREQNSEKSLLADFQSAVETRWQNSVQWFSVFLYHDWLKKAWNTVCIKMVMRWDVMALNDVLCKWRHRTKRQSKSTKILLANNFIAIIHLFEYKKYQFYTFLLEPLAKKVCSVSFVSQHIIESLCEL